MGVFVIKLGSSVVADDVGRLREDVMESVCAETAGLLADGLQPVIVSSGAIARGLNLLGKGRPREIQALQAASAVGQGRLYHSFDEGLSAHDAQSAQVLLTFVDISARAHYLNARRTLQQLLAWRVVPVINENDTTTTDEISFGDNDFLAAQVAILLGAERLTLLTSTDGLYTSDPGRNPDAELLRVIDGEEAIAALQLDSTTSALGTGGMRSKVLAAQMASAAGVPATIANGRKPGTIAAIAAGTPIGTEFPARVDPQPSFKLWLRYAKLSRGQVQVDAGAARALRRAGTSLLPVGVVNVTGEFEAGDAIEITDQDRKIVGKGISNYSAQDLTLVRGMHSDQIQRVLPGSSEEAVHRDYFVLA